MAQRSKKSTLFFILFMVFVSAGYLAIVLIGTSMIIPDQKVAVEIAGRLQTTPSRDAILDHLFFNEFKPGMTREEVHKVLDKVGPWTGNFDSNRGWDADTQQYVYTEIIHFTERSTSQVIGYWGFNYTKDDVLVDRELIDIY
jgi:hypothetical protein